MSKGTTLLLRLVIDAVKFSIALMMPSMFTAQSRPVTISDRSWMALCKPGRRKG